MMMRAFQSHIQKLKSDSSGTSVLELAVVLPVLMTIGLGAIEFGNLIYRQHLIVNGVRDAARYGAALKYKTTAPTANVASIKNMAVYGSYTTGTARVTGWVPGDVSVAIVGQIIPNACGGQRCSRIQTDVPVITVSTSFTYQSLGFLNFLGITGPLTLNASHQERVIEVEVPSP